jgi:hypothetical protein
VNGFGGGGRFRTAVPLAASLSDAVRDQLGYSSASLEGRKMRVEHFLIRVACACLASALSGCSNDGVSTPTRGPTPTPPPTGTFAVASTTPASGGTVFGPAEAVSGQPGDLSGTKELAIAFQMTYSESIPSFSYVVELLNGQTECLRAGSAYCPRTDDSPLFNSYTAGRSATFLCQFFIRDSQQPTCGPTFTTDRIRYRSPGPKYKSHAVRSGSQWRLDVQVRALGLQGRKE